MYNRRRGNQHHGVFFLFFSSCLFAVPNKGILKKSNFLEAHGGFLCDFEGESFNRSCSRFTGSSVSVLGIHRTENANRGKKIVPPLNLFPTPPFFNGS